MAVALGKRRNAALDASGPALRGFQAKPRSAFDRQPACLQSGALIADLPESLSALPLFRGALDPTEFLEALFEHIGYFLAGIRSPALQLFACGYAAL